MTQIEQLREVGKTEPLEMLLAADIDSSMHDRAVYQYTTPTCALLIDKITSNCVNKDVAAFILIVPYDRVVRFFELGSGGLNITILPYDTLYIVIEDKRINPLEPKFPILTLHGEKISPK